MARTANPKWDVILTASMRNDAERIRHLVENEGVDPSHANPVSQSALHIASLWGNVEAVEELLKQGAAINVQNKMTGATPLHCATQSIKGSKERRIMCMQRLINAGADVTLADFNGKIPADHCEGDSELIKLLSPEHPALFQAIDEGNVEQIQQLLKDANDNNSDSETPPVYEESFRGKTPFQYVLDMLLKEEDETTDRPKSAKILQTLLDAGADPNSTPEANPLANPMAALEDDPVLPPLARVCTALQEALKTNDDDKTVSLLKETCQLLLKHNATVTPDLEQSLHTACRKNDMKSAKLLIETIQIDPNVKGRQGMTPLQFAARSGKTEMVQYLLSLPKIDVSVQDDRGQTALDAARINNKQEIVQLLEAFAAAADNK